MGLLDMMFGGGTKLELALDAKEVPPGGILSGQATLTGGKKPLQLTAMKVRLLYVATESVPGQSLPKIDTRVLLDNTVAQNLPIPAGAPQTHKFSFEIPMGTLPTAHNVSYTVQVVADIPSVKDPSATANLKVVQGKGDSQSITANELYTRWPALKGTEEGPLCDALRDMRWKHDLSTPGNDLLVAEPILARLLREGSEEVQRHTLGTWSEILKDRAKKEHVATLAELAKKPGLESYTVLEVIDAAAKFAKAGGMAIIREFAKHADPEVRSRVAQSLHFGEGAEPEKLAVLQPLASDADAGVRAAAVDSLGRFDKSKEVMALLAKLIQAEQSPEVLEAAVRALRGGYYNKLAALVDPAYTQLLQSPHARVRTELAHAMSSAQYGTNVIPWVAKLLADADEGVRKEMAWELRNMKEKAAELAPLAQKLADADPSDQVKGAALGSLAELRPLAEVSALYTRLMAGPMSEPVARGIVHGFKFRMEPECKAVLQKMMQSPYAEVAREARDGFEFRA